MIDTLLTSDWFGAAMRLIFVGGIYLFLFLVLRSTVRDLTSVAVGERKAGASPHQASLVVLDGSGSSLVQGAVFLLEDDVYIGREAGLAVVLDDSHVSARHAELSYRHDQWWLRDLGSSNGTLLNGQSVHSVVAVRSGDVLQCAAVRLRFVSPPVHSAGVHVT